MDGQKVDLSALAARFGLDQTQIGQLAEVVDVLGGEGAAPSSVTDPERAIDVHLADSLVALQLEEIKCAARAVDIGAGAGFPGVPLAVAVPGCEVTLLESQARKCEYLERVLRAARIENARVECARAEGWPAGIGVHDLALARAVAAQPVVLEYAAPLLTLGGALVDWRGRRSSSEEDAASRAASELGLRLVCVRQVQPYAGVRDHHLHVYVKEHETPERFPRRVGVARKKPLAKFTPAG